MSEPITTALRGLLCAKPKGDPCWDAMDAVDAVHAGLERENSELRAKLDESGDSMHDGGSITDDLRRLIEDSLLGIASQDTHIEVLTKIADRIDAAYHAAYQDGENAILAVFDKRGNSDVDKTMAEHGWYRVLDADKKPIRLGDKVYQVKGGWVYTVKSISLYPDNTTVTFSCEHGYGCDSAHNVRHYHEPTVEDVLREFARECLTYATCVDDHEVQDAIEMYAAKLRLAEGEDA